MTSQQILDKQTINQQGYTYIYGETALPDYLITPVSYEGLSKEAKDNLRKVYRQALQVLDFNLDK